jgi:hypothetical protein
VAAKTVEEVLREALEDFARHGYDSQERLQMWQGRLEEAARANFSSSSATERVMREYFAAIYRQQIERGGIARRHPGVSRFTLDRVKPELRAELARRVRASADLIKLNRAEEIPAMLRRFAGFVTSIPAGGSDSFNKRDEAKKIRKSLSGLSFRERRLMIDQGHKLQSAMSSVIATGGGAIGAVWHSHWRQANYDYRDEHKERDGKLYVVRGNWALEKGLMKLAGHAYTDDETQPGEEVFCRCYYTYIYSLRDLPKEMLTEKGRAELARLDERKNAA